MAVNHTPTGARPRQRLLLLCPRWPYPVRGGDKVRIWNLAKALSQHFQVTLLTFCRFKHEMTCEVPLDGVFTEVHRVYLPSWRSRIQAALAVLGDKPLQVAYYESPEFQRKVHQLLPRHDLLCCHLIRMAQYAHTTNVPAWMEMTDVISLTLRRAENLNCNRARPIRLMYRLEARRMERYERETMCRFELLTLVSDVDRDHLVKQVAGNASITNVVVAGNGVNYSGVLEIPPMHLRKGMAFVGQMTSLANRDAIRHFVDDILPKVRQQNPDAELHIVGEVLPADEVKLRSTQGVRVHGTKDDIGEILLSCRVGICPVRFGAGIQNKVLDYMSFGMATVTSPIGLEGLSAVDGRDLIVADGEDDWAAAIDCLLRDSAKAARLGMNARNLVRDRYGWGQALEPAIDAARALRD